MDPDSSRERTARWIQSQFSSGSARQPQTHLSLPKSHLQRQYSLAHSNQTESSSRTAISQPRGNSNVVSVTSPHSAKSRTPAYDAHTHRPSTRPFIPTAIYHKPNLPAFVQGPPGSGFPKSMLVSPLSLSATVIKPPSPPPNIPIPLNPKVRVYWCHFGITVILLLLTSFPIGYACRSLDRLCINAGLLSPARALSRQTAI